MAKTRVLDSPLSGSLIGTGVAMIIFAPYLFNGSKEEEKLANALSMTGALCLLFGIAYGVRKYHYYSNQTSQPDAPREKKLPKDSKKTEISKTHLPEWTSAQKQEALPHHESKTWWIRSKEYLYNTITYPGQLLTKYRASSQSNQFFSFNDLQLRVVTGSVGTGMIFIAPYLSDTIIMLASPHVSDKKGLDNFFLAWGSVILVIAVTVGVGPYRYYFRQPSPASPLPDALPPQLSAHQNQKKGTQKEDKYIQSAFRNFKGMSRRENEQKILAVKSWRVKGKEMISTLTVYTGHLYETVMTFPSQLLKYYSPTKQAITPLLSDEKAEENSSQEKGKAPSHSSSSKKPPSSKEKKKIQKSRNSRQETSYRSIHLRSSATIRHYISLTQGGNLNLASRIEILPTVMHPSMNDSPASTNDSHRIVSSSVILQDKKSAPLPIKTESAPDSSSEKELPASPTEPTSSHIEQKELPGISTPSTVSSEQSPDIPLEQKGLERMAELESENKKLKEMNQNLENQVLDLRRKLAAILTPSTAPGKQFPDIPPEQKGQKRVAELESENKRLKKEKQDLEKEAKELRDGSKIQEQRVDHYKVIASQQNAAAYYFSSRLTQLLFSSYQTYIPPYFRQFYAVTQQNDPHHPAHFPQPINHPQPHP